MNSTLEPLEFLEHSLPGPSTCRFQTTSGFSAPRRQLPNGSVFLPARLPPEVQDYDLPTLPSFAISLCNGSQHRDGGLGDYTWFLSPVTESLRTFHTQLL